MNRYTDHALEADQWAGVAEVRRQIAAGSLPGVMRVVSRLPREVREGVFARLGWTVSGRGVQDLLAGAQREILAAVQARCVAGLRYDAGDGQGVRWYNPVAFLQAPSPIPAAEDPAAALQLDLETFA